MNFGAAIEKCMRNYVGFDGRAARSEYWFFVLFNFLACMAALLLDTVLGMQGGGLFYVLTVIGLFLPGLAVGIRRLHDLDRSGWWFLIALVPIVGGIVLLVWFCTPGSAEPNQYGEDPLTGDSNYAGPRTRNSTHLAGDLDRLDRLSEMLGRGTITQEEFDAQKAAILRTS